MWHATAQVVAKAPTPTEIRRGAFSHEGWDEEIQRRHSVISEENVRKLTRNPSYQQSLIMSPPAPKPLRAHVEEDAEDDPFDKFVGRGKMDNQSFTRIPKANAGEHLDPLDSLKGTGVENIRISIDSEDSIDALEGLPKRKSKAGRLPKKFQDPDDPKFLSKFAPSSTLAPTRPATITSKGIQSSSTPAPEPAKPPIGPNTEGVYPNGYKFPPKHNWKESTVIGLKAFWRFTLTPFGFLVVLYGLNVVAWGGMLFLLLIGGGKQYMCYPERLHGVKDCNDLYSPRRIWIEIDSQILNALFCVTGLGLIPWRFRDLYYLLRYRVQRKQDGLRRLAGIHRSWFRMEGTQNLPVPLKGHETPEILSLTALPPSKNPADPLTGIRAPPTKLWKLDFVIWAYVWNTFLQITLCAFMWGLNRFDRPSWSTGTFVALACIVAGLGGLMAGVEGKAVKKVEGIPVEEAKKPQDTERGIVEKKGGTEGQLEEKVKETTGDGVK